MVARIVDSMVSAPRPTRAEATDIANSVLTKHPFDVQVCMVARIVDSMVSAPRPTRAEATDIANSVLDGADGFVLGNQTTQGCHPVEAVRTVLGICREAEAAFDFKSHFERTSAMLRDVRAPLSLSLPARVALFVALFAAPLSRFQRVQHSMLRDVRAPHPIFQRV